MSIVFGSPEAKAILERDKKMQRLTDEDSREWIEARIEEIEEEIGAMETKIMILEMELDNLKDKLEDKLEE
jgi:predicted RNase H-like nuclease (RuvC/YqgF family)